MNDYRYIQEDNLLINTEPPYDDLLNKPNQNRTTAMDTETGHSGQFYMYIGSKAILLTRKKLVFLMFTTFFFGCIVAGCTVFGILSSSRNKTSTTDFTQNGPKAQQSGLQREEQNWRLWSSWTTCSVSCGNGTQYRSRKREGTSPHTECRQNDSQVCEMGECKNDYTINMDFDVSYLHGKWYLSDNNRILSNTYTAETKNSPDGDKQLQNYEGVIADVCAGPKDIIYYTIRYNYTLVLSLQRHWLLFETGLAELDKIDDSHYVGNKKINGWSFHVLNCPKFYKKACISADRGSLYFYRQPLSSNQAGTMEAGSISVLINRPKNEYSLIKDGKVVYKFKNVIPNVCLYPTFAVYNEDKATVKLQLMNTYNYTSFTDPISKFI